MLSVRKTDAGVGLSEKQLRVLSACPFKRGPKESPLRFFAQMASYGHVLPPLAAEGIYTGEGGVADA